MMSARHAGFERQLVDLNSIWPGRGRDGLISALSTVFDSVITAMCSPSPIDPRRMSPALDKIGWRLVRANFVMPRGS